MQTNEGNQFFCDIESGVCNLPDQNLDYTINGKADLRQQISILFFTDPICSSCWGIEPQLRKLKLEYGGHFKIEYKMGGLLPSWNTYAGNDVKTPEDVAKHWDMAGSYYDMPIDGDIWLEDSLDTSYTPCIAFKAAQLQDDLKASIFLRKIKEMVFLKKMNITKWDHLKSAAIEAGLDVEKMKNAIHNDAKENFTADLNLAKQLGIKGFPSIVFTNGNKEHHLLYGFRPYEEFEQAIVKWNPLAVKTPINTNYHNLFKAYPTLTTKEFSVLTQKNKAEAETFLNQLYELNHLSRFTSKTGYLWSVS